jgi:hypothetical protein
LTQTSPLIETTVRAGQSEQVTCDVTACRGRPQPEKHWFFSDFPDEVQEPCDRLSVRPAMWNDLDTLPPNHLSLPRRLHCPENG